VAVANWTGEMMRKDEPKLLASSGTQLYFMRKATGEE
jgi:hypothetical protein